MRLRDAGMDMPPWNGGQDAKDIWTYASAKFASYTKGNAHVVLGDCTPSKNTLFGAEIPRLQEGKQVRCIFAFRPSTGFEVPEIFWEMDSSSPYCKDQLTQYEASIACLSFDAAGWRRSSNDVSSFAAYYQAGHGPTWRYGGLYTNVRTPVEYHYMNSIDTGANPTSGSQYMKSRIGADTYISAIFASTRQRMPNMVRLSGGTYSYDNDFCRFSLEGTSSAGTSRRTLERRDLAGRNLRTLPLGDSITWGYKSSDGNGYRQHLEDLLAGNNVDYVGSQSSGDMSDNQNEGRPGYEIDQIAQFFSDDAKMKPNVVLMAGTNDINNNDNTDAAPDRLYSLIDNLVNTLPDAAIVVSEIIQIEDASAESRQLLYNGRLVEVAIEFNMRSSIQFADLNGDGRADYLVVDPTSGSVTEYLNGGNAPDNNGSNAAKVVWYPQGVIATGVGTNGLGISFGDLNGDGRAEYLDVNPLSSAASAWLNGC